MEKIAFIPQFETPIVFMYPLSRLGSEFGVPCLAYAFLMLPKHLLSTNLLAAFVVAVLVHILLLGLLFWFINSRFPIMIAFEMGGVSFSRMIGKKIHIPYESLHAILESPMMTVFALKGGQKFFFLPIQTDREEEFCHALHAIQSTLQTRRKS